MQSQRPVHTTAQNFENRDASRHNGGFSEAMQAEQNSGLQVLCLEVEKQLNRHYRRLLGFFSSAFTDRRDYPLSAPQALMLFCVSNGLQDTVQLCRAAEPVTGQAVIILASLYAQGYVASVRMNGDAPALTEVLLTPKGQAVADGLHDLYHHVFLDYAGRDVPDAARLAAMHVSLARLQNYERQQQSRLP